MAYNSGNPNGQATSANSAPVVIASDQSTLPVRGSYGSLVYASWTSATAANTVLSISTAGFTAVSVPLTVSSTMTAGALAFEVSADNSTWFPVLMTRTDSYTTESTYTLNTVTNRTWTGTIGSFGYFRVRLSTAITGTGTASIGIVPQALPMATTVTVGNSNAANLQATVSGTVTATVTSTSGIIGANPTLSAAGLTVFSNQSLTATPVAVKTSAARMYEFDFYNSNASGVWIQLFNAAAGSVTLGTTVPTRTIYIPPSSGRDWQAPYSDAWSTALTIACTTTNTGSTAPAAGIQAYIGYI